MRHRLVVLCLAVAGTGALIGGMLPAGAGPAPVADEEFLEPGEFEFDVPADVCEIEVDASGAAGAPGSNGEGAAGGQTGGQGGRSIGTITTTPGETLAIVVGQPGLRR